jgi:hypothetical protein
MTMAGSPRWLVLTWRLPSGSSTPRVALWRSLRRLGGVGLTPGAAILPFREDLQEQLDWLAQDIDEQGGVAWVLPVTELREQDEDRVREQMRLDRQAEYEELRVEASAFLDRASVRDAADSDHALRVRTDRELLALQRRFRKIRDRDWFGAPGRAEAARTIDRCLVFRQGTSSRLQPVTDGGS